MNSSRIFRLTIFLGVLASLAPLSTDMYLPALPIMHNDFGSHASLIQLTLSMTMIGIALGQIFIGPISDRIGRKPPLIIGMAFFTAASFGCVLSENIYVFLVFRFIQGFAGSFGIVSARAVASDVASGAQLTKFFSILMLVNGLAPILAPVIGGQLLRLADWRGIFAVMTFIGLVLFISSSRFTETLPASRRKADSSDGSYVSLLRDRYFFGQCIVQGSAYVAFFGYIAGSSFLFQNIYNLSPQTYSLIFGGFGVAILLAGTIPVKLAGHVPTVKMLAWILIQAFVGSILFALCIIFNAPIKLTILSLLVILPTISILSATSFSLAMYKHRAVAATASSMLGFAQMLAGGIAAPLVGVAGSHNALPMAIVIFLGELCALMAFMKFIYPSHKKSGGFWSMS